MASLMEALLAEDATRSGSDNALLAGMTGRGGAYRDLTRSVIDPETGKRQAYKAATGEVVKRGKLLPAGITDNGRLVPALPMAITDALSGVNAVGDVATGQSPAMDPTTGEPPQAILDFIARQGAGLLGSALPQPKGASIQDILAMLQKSGQGRTVSNLGMGRR